MWMSSASNALEMTTARKLSSSVLLLALLLYGRVELELTLTLSYLVPVTTSEIRDQSGLTDSSVRTLYMQYVHREARTSNRNK